MVIQLDRCYKINFKSQEDGGGANFSLLDGFYEVVRSYGWNELTGAGIDLQKNLLDHAGIVDTTTIRSLQTNWINDAFYLCIGMDQDRQIWVPESIIKGYPEPRIGSYKKLGLLFDLGVFANQEDFATLGKDIMRYLRTNYGIDKPDATLMIYGNEWMTIEDYENTDLRRKHLQGKVFVNTKRRIRPSTEFITTKVEFGKPIILTKDEEIQPGAISDSIKVVYGLDLKDIPEGNIDLEEQCWYYEDTNDYIDREATSIEQMLDSTNPAFILKSINVKTKFTAESYKWCCGDNVLYTSELTPSENSAVYSSPLCDTASQLCDKSGLEVTYILVDSYTPPNELSEAAIDVGGNTYVFDTSNYIEIDVGYRCRNTKINSESPYSIALKYAYENKKLRQRIDALTNKLTKSSTGTINQ